MPNTDICSPRPTKVYLGEAVYAEWIGHNILKLTTSNSRNEYNTIYCGPEVVMALQRYITKGPDNG